MHRCDGSLSCSFLSACLLLEQSHRTPAPSRRTTIIPSSILSTPHPEPCLNPSTSCLRVNPFPVLIHSLLHTHSLLIPLAPAHPFCSSSPSSAEQAPRG